MLDSKNLSFHFMRMRLKKWSPYFWYSAGSKPQTYSELTFPYVLSKSVNPSVLFRTYPYKYLVQFSNGRFLKKACLFYLQDFASSLGCLSLSKKDHLLHQRLTAFETLVLAWFCLVRHEGSGFLPEGVKISLILKFARFPFLIFSSLIPCLFLFSIAVLPGVALRFHYLVHLLDCASNSLTW